MKFGLTFLMLLLLWGNRLVCGQAILSAAGTGDTVKVAHLLEANPSAVNARDSFSKRTPLHFATEKGHLDVAELLLKKGADINAQDYMGMTPLHWAVDRQQKDVVEFLIANKAQLDVTNEKGDTPLQLTVWNKTTDLAELLIARGAGLEVTNKNGGTVFLTAAVNGKKNLVDLLLVKGAKSYDVSKALRGAVQHGHTEVVRLLLARGADANTVDEEGMSPLHYAAKQCRADLIEMLLANGADTNRKDKYGQTPLDQLAQSWCNNQQKVVEILRAHGGKMSIWGATGLGLEEDVKELLKTNQQLVASRDNGGALALMPFEY
ncbi:MAG: hypothetical protein EXS18_01445 [Verrucomicrobiae bacterium]|nr:hypothetical protein [Verrucomicrobiae bacterium]